MTARRAIAVLVAALALSACRVDTTVHLAVRADGSGTITVTAVADKELVDKTPGLAKDLRFDDAVKAGWVVDGPTATATGGLQVSLAHSFASPQEATALLASLNGSDGPLHGITVTRTVSGGRATTALAGTLRIANGLDAFADPDVLKAIGGSPFAKDLADLQLKPSDVVTFTFSADLPGTLQGTPSGTAASTGTAAPATAAGSAPGTSGRTITWAVPLDGATTNVAATAVLDGRTSDGVWHWVSIAALVALVVWTVLAVGFILYVARARHERALRRSQ